MGKKQKKNKDLQIEFRTLKQHKMPQQDGKDYVEEQVCQERNFVWDK